MLGKQRWVMDRWVRRSLDRTCMMPPHTNLLPRSLLRQNLRQPYYLRFENHEQAQCTAMAFDGSCPRVHQANSGGFSGSGTHQLSVGRVRAVDPDSGCCSVFSWGRTHEMNSSTSCHSRAPISAHGKCSSCSGGTSPMQLLPPSWWAMLSGHHTPWMPQCAIFSTCRHEQDPDFKLGW